MCSYCNAPQSKIIARFEAEHSQQTRTGQIIQAAGCVLTAMTLNLKSSLGF